jgi:rubrerythrin
MAYLIKQRRQKHIEIYEPVKAYVNYESGSGQLYKRELKLFNDLVFVCSNCNHRVEDFEGKYCGYCGERLEGIEGEEP